MKLKKGIYEHLITGEMLRNIEESEAQGLVCKRAPIDEAESPSMLADYLGLKLKNLLKDMPREKRAEFTNRVVEVATDDNADDDVADDKEMLAEVISAETEGIRKATNQQQTLRPQSGFRVSNLFTGGQSVLSLSSEIERDIVSADRISLIVSFLKLSGVNMIYDRLQQFCNVPGHQLRIITTTYCGVTEAKAVARLAQLPNTEIRISYQTNIERLHAKAYIFERQSGMSTAYIGSSNLSKSAQTDGLEWNIRVTNVENPHIIKTALATFDQYWESPNFEDFSVGGVERFREQLELSKLTREAGSGSASGNLRVPKIIQRYVILPHQKQILDKLLVEREQGIKRNLIVAATGTGKTVISAFDFQYFSQQMPDHRKAKILFVAHREEILTQALATYRSVLGDWNFGDLWVGDNRPTSLDQLFVSVQTLNSHYDSTFSLMSPQYYDYLVIDEAHHATADTYQRIIEHFQPQLLIGLTATPERMDGVSLLPDFDNKISAEIRLPKALDEGLLTPFQYFCISDQGTDLSDGELMQGGRYITSRLYDRLCTTDRVRVVTRSLETYIANEHACRALCFCADKRHARYMADHLNEAGYRAAWLTSDNTAERNKLNRQLAEGQIQYLCVVDIFNEGVDIPQVDTVLFLRPTESLTIFLQQLGRGLRLAPGKQLLTVLDFVAQFNRNYDYAGRFRSLMLRTDKSFKEQIQNGFTLLPHGCSIHLEEKAQEEVLRNITSAIYNKKRLVDDLRTYPQCPSLTDFMEQIGQDIRLIYRGGLCWTRLKREAGKCNYREDDITNRLAKGIGYLVHINTPAYLRFIQRVMKANGDTSWVSAPERPYVLMLYYSLFQDTVQKMGVHSAAEALNSLSRYPLFVQEIEELTDYLLAHLEVRTFALGQGMPALLEQYGCYTREEIFSLFGWQTETKKMQGSVLGVINFADYDVEAFFVTLNKSDKDFSPSTQYDDYVMSNNYFHWQSQNKDSHSGSGRRFVEQRTNKKRFLLFVREEKKDGFGNTSPFYCFGFVNYVRSYGDRPMNIEWRLEHPVLPQFIKAV
jgi:superfamily II DNA or RNA helicase/HKD family nuclease